MRVLLTGGMGFIGSHTAVSLLEAGHEPILYDNLSNADRSVVDRIGRITGHTPTFIEEMCIRDSFPPKKELPEVINLSGAFYRLVRFAISRCGSHACVQSE